MLLGENVRLASSHESDNCGVPNLPSIRQKRCHHVGWVLEDVTMPLRGFCCGILHYSETVTSEAADANWGHFSQEIGGNPRQT
jgi:hypothetical protein